MRKTLIAAAGVAVLALVAGCSSTSTTSTPSASTGSASEMASSAPAATDAAMDMCGTTIDEIAAAAKAEGKVNLIALPDTWANYKGVLEAFRTAYGIEAPVANPDASSADELTAIKTLRGQPDMPDSVDVGPSFTQQLMDEGLSEPYITTNWDEIPDVLKDPNGNWVGAYYGIMSIATNATLVPNAPRTWADLAKPEYKGQVTLNGDPREAGAAFAGVVAAALANGGSYDDIMPGIEYFAGLKKSGNLQVIDVTEAALLSGDVPIALDWSYNFPAIASKMKDAGFDVQVVIPEDGLYGSYYAQSVVSDAVHPCAAKLWIEHITGDAGALAYLAGGAIPARFKAMVASGVITPDMTANLPSAEQIAKISFPTAAQIEGMKAAITENWGPMVADL